MVFCEFPKWGSVDVCVVSPQETFCHTTGKNLTFTPKTKKKLPLSESHPSVYYVFKKKRRKKAVSDINDEVKVQTGHLGPDIGH